VHELIRRARLRLLNQELISQGAIAFSAALIAFIVLLLLGTQILNWYWIALIPAAALGAGVYGAYRRRPSSYRTAQIVDHRLTLADTLSTAVYFSEQPADVGVVGSQRQSAERTAASVDLGLAIPYRLPRSAYVVAALALVASSLFALRYGLSKRLDLRAPMVRMLQNRFSPDSRKETAENARRDVPLLDSPDDNADAPGADPDQKGQNKKDANSDNPGEGDRQNGEKSGASKDDGKKQSGDPQDQDGAQSQQSEDHDQQQDGGQSGSNSQGENKSDQNKQSDGKQNSNNSGESGSLMSKIKDFAENLLSKMKPQQSNSSQQQQAPNQNSKQASGQQNAKQQQKDGQQSGSQQADSQGENSDDAKEGQDSQGKGSGQDKSQQATKQPGSGIGSEDGDKQIRQAEQLAAMGKISELIGKRSAAVTGEATVEVQTTSQQLHTAYVKSGAEHSQGGAEINRDEIPVALQPYVEQYFDQLRKQPTAVKKQ
jgi:hypothetical protein